MTDDRTGSWQTSPPDLSDEFAAGTARVLAEPGVERRMMFGYPACFVNGNLFTSLFRDRWVVRLPDDDRAALAAAGGEAFSPVPGRPMTGYLLLPRELATSEASRPWVERALVHGRSLPPKRKR